MISAKEPPFVLLELRQLEYFPLSLSPELENERDFCREQAFFLDSLFLLDLEGLNSVRAK